MKVVPALAAGNCVVVKPSEFTPFSPDLFAQLLREAGVPQGVCTILTGGPEAGAALVRHPKVAKVSFAGGPVAARQIMHACADQLKPAVLELGGKTASLVFPDAGDLDAVANRAVRDCIGVLAGQGCAVPSRLIVHEDIHDEMVERVTAIAATYKVGDPFDPEVKVGPLINAAAVERVCGMLDRVRRDGAGRIVLGGSKAGGDLADKNFVEPTIIVDTDPDHEIAQTEIFGPVLLIFKFSTDDEAVALANSTPYGLGANIQSTNLIGKAGGPGSTNSCATRRFPSSSRSRPKGAEAIPRPLFYVHLKPQWRHRDNRAAVRHRLGRRHPTRRSARAAG